jgi:hypothetical protein
MKKTLRLLLWALIIAAASWSIRETFSLPSTLDKTWLGGLSPQRFLIAFLPGISILCSLFMIILLLVLPNRYLNITSHFKQLPPHQALISGIISFWCALLAGSSLVYYRLVIAPDMFGLTKILGIAFPNLCAYIDRLWALVAFIVFCLFCWTIYVVLVLKQSFLKNIFWLAACGAGVLSLFAALFQWVVLYFRLHIFEQIPGWYWPIIVKPDLNRHAIIFALFLLFFLLILFLTRRFPKNTIIHLVLISLAFIILQYTIGFMEGRGVASLSDRFFLSYHRAYIEKACNATISPQEAIANYEKLYRPSIFLRTKPPGVLWTAFLTNQIANLPGLSSVLDSFSASIPLSKYVPAMTTIPCQRSMALVTLASPLLSTLIIWVIYAFSRWIFSDKEYGALAIYSSIFFVLAPNVVMLPLFPDQTFYPFLFLSVAGGIFYFMRKRDPIGNFICGIVLYIAIFLTFSVLPLLITPLFYFFFTLWQERRLADIWKDFMVTLLPMGLGGLVSLLAFKFWLNYDIFTRYQNMTSSRIVGDFYDRFGTKQVGEPSLLEKLSQTVNALLLNNIELAAAISFPIFIFAVLMGLRSFWLIIRRQADTAAPINASLFLSYVCLNAMRVVLGEAARLWIFWLPMMALLTVQYCLPLIRRKPWPMITLVVIQVITLFLTYQFQDFLMPQWLP